MKDNEASADTLGPEHDTRPYWLLLHGDRKHIYGQLNSSPRFVRYRHRLDPETRAPALTTIAPVS